MPAGLGGGLFTQGGDHEACRLRCLVWGWGDGVAGTGRASETGAALGAAHVSPCTDGDRSCHVARGKETAKDPVFRPGWRWGDHRRPGRAGSTQRWKGLSPAGVGAKMEMPSSALLLEALLTPQHAGEGRGSKGRRCAPSGVVLGSARSRAPCPDHAPSTHSLPQKPPAMAHTHRPPRLVVLPLSHFTDGEPEAQGAPITTGVADAYWAPAVCQALTPSYRPGLWDLGLFICFS